MKNPTIRELIKRHGDPLFRFKPVRRRTLDDQLNNAPIECAVFKISDKHPAGLIVYSRYHRTRWTPNEGERYVIQKLLTN